MAYEREPLRYVNTLSRQRQGSTGRADRVQEMRSYRPMSRGRAEPPVEESAQIPANYVVTPDYRDMAPGEEGEGTPRDASSPLGASTRGMAAAQSIAGRENIGQDILGDYAVGGLKTAAKAYDLGITDPTDLSHVAARSMMTPSAIGGVVNETAGAALGMSDVASALDDSRLSDDDVSRAVAMSGFDKETRGTLEMSPDVRSAVEAIDAADYSSVSDQILGGVTSGVASLFGVDPEPGTNSRLGKSRMERFEDAIDPTMADKAAVDRQVSEFANTEAPSTFGNVMGIGTDENARINTEENRQRLKLGLPLLPTTVAAAEAESGGPGVNGMSEQETRDTYSPSDVASYDAYGNKRESAPAKNYGPRSQEAIDAQRAFDRENGLDGGPRGMGTTDSSTGTSAPGTAGRGRGSAAREGFSGYGGGGGGNGGDGFGGGGYDGTGNDGGQSTGGHGSHEGAGSQGANEGRGDSDNDGGSDGDRVICSQLVAVGISHPLFLRADNLFAKIHCSRELVAGYHFWAKPLVRLMQRLPLWFTHKCVKPWGMAYSYHCQHVLGLREKDSTGGRLFARIVMPACELIGKLIRKGR